MNDIVLNGNQTKLSKKRMVPQNKGEKIWIGDDKSTWETSYLQGIPKKETKINNTNNEKKGIEDEKKKALFSRAVKKEVIEGSQPKSSIQKFGNKISLVNKIDDIDGSAPTKMYRSDRMTDPNNPVYKLPSNPHEEKERELAKMEHSKFIRDTLTYYNDVVYANKKKNRISSRNDVTPSTGNEVDISKDGSNAVLAKKHDMGKLIGQAYYSDSPKKEEKKHRNKENRSMDVKDINEGDKFRTKRQTNPNDPFYGEKYENPLMKNNRNKTTKSMEKTIDLVLKCDDINRKEEQHFHHLPRGFPLVRRNIRDPVDVTDVYGAKPQMKTGTFHIRTKRSTNPLDPEY